MTEAQRPIPIDDLMAYVDGRLGASDRARVESAIAQDAGLRAQVEAYREQNRALHALFDGVLDEPVPARMRMPERRRPGRLLAGLAAMLVAGLAIGWFARGLVSVPVPVMAFAQQAAVAHVAYSPEVRHPVEVAANEEAHLVQWLSKRLGRKVFAPDLSSQGYRLVGGRLLPGEPGKVAAQFMYENQSGQRLTLYIRALTSRRDTAFRYAREAGVDTFYWVDNEWGYALTGSIGREAMLALADVVYKQISPG